MTSLLDRELANHPQLEGAASLLRAVLRAVREIPVILPPDVPHLEAARARLAEGIPALAGERLLAAQDLVRGMQLIAAAIESTDDGAEAGSAIRLLLERHADALAGPLGRELADAALAGDWSAVSSIAARLGVDDAMMIVVADDAARPALCAAAGRVKPLLAGLAWERGTCPACGAPPLLAELHGGEGDRVLRCGRCASAWRFPRVMCATCGSRDHRTLGSLHVDGEQAHRRADRCDACRTYLKAIAVLGPLSADELLEADLATAGLDLIAVERGYRRA